MFGNELSSISQNSIACFIALLFRVGGSVSVLPLGEGFQAISRRGLLTFLLATALFCFIPVNPSSPPSASIIALSTLLEYALEFILGMILAMPLAIAAELAVSWGELFDAARGQTISSMYDPVQGNSHSTMGVLVEQAIWVSLISCGALEALLKPMVISLQSFPLGALLDKFFWQFGLDLLSLLSRAVGSMIQLAVIPAIIFLLIELAFGIISKAVPSTSFCSESFQLKTYCGIFFLVLICRTEFIQNLTVQIANQPTQVLSAIARPQADPTNRPGFSHGRR